MYSLALSTEICNAFSEFSFAKMLSDVYREHLMTIIHSIFMPGYKGKIVNCIGQKHRTSIAHFLNDGKWNSSALKAALKQRIINRVYNESIRSGKPIYCIVDDTIASHTTPSSQAEHPIEAAYFHKSHLKNGKDYGHQAVGIMLACNGMVLNYAMELYDKTRSKIAIVQSVASELPVPPGQAYLLCDSWYASNKLMDSFAIKGFETICALKGNRIIYPHNVKQQAKHFAPNICKDDPNVSLVTVGNRRFYVYRYEGKMNEHENAVVLITYAERMFGNPKALRVFMSTSTELSTQEILDAYVTRWKIETFFRECKQKLAFDKCQLRKQRGIERMWLILSLVYYFCCVVPGMACDFQRGYAFLKKSVLLAVFHSLDVDEFVQLLLFAHL